MRFILITFLLAYSLLANGFPAEYYKIKNSQAMKNYFFNFMYKIAKQQNKYILEDREFIKANYYKHNTFEKDSCQYNKIKTIKNRYKLKDTDSLEKYLSRIDIIPNSLVIVQAAVESGWGKSRFTKEANNIFGQWTWTGKGLIPRKRDEGKKHKIKIFGSLEGAVRGYMLNLNTNQAYKELRKLRVKIRKYKAPLSGLAFSRTLINYSQIKEEYTKLLGIMIVKNHLQRFDD